MSTQITDFQKKNEETIKEIGVSLDKAKAQATNQVRIKDGEHIDLQFIWNPSKEEETLKLVEEDTLEFKDGKPVKNDDGTYKKKGTRIRVYCPVIDQREPDVVKIWNASRTDFKVNIEAIKNLGKSEVRITRYGNDKNTKYGYLPLK